jgi:hypothetical protein
MDAPCSSDLFGVDPRREVNSVCGHDSIVVYGRCTWRAARLVGHISVKAESGAPRGSYFWTYEVEGILADREMTGLLAKGPGHGSSVLWVVAD